MPSPRLTYRNRGALPALGAADVSQPLLLDTNIFLHALTGRGPPILKTLLANLPRSFVSAPTVAELAWSRGRLDPAHAQTARVLTIIATLLNRIDAAKILTPTADQWRLAGERAGEAVRGVAGGPKSFRTPAERHEMLNDALTAIVASEAGVTIVTQDADFDLFMQLDPALNVLFY